MSLLVVRVVSLGGGEAEAWLGLLLESRANPGCVGRNVCVPNKLRQPCKRWRFSGVLHCPETDIKMTRHDNGFVKEGAELFSLLHRLRVPFLALFFLFFNCEANRCSTSPATPPFPISKSSTSNWHWRVCLTSLRSVSFHSRLLLLPLYPFECNERRGRTGKKKREANKGRQMTGTNYAGHSDPPVKVAYNFACWTWDRNLALSDYVGPFPNTLPLN